VNSSSKTQKKVIQKTALAHGQNLEIAGKKQRFQRNPPVRDNASAEGAFIDFQGECTTSTAEPSSTLDCSELEKAKNRDNGLPSCGSSYGGGQANDVH
jgi:hypothetical protein